MKRIIPLTTIVFLLLLITLSCSKGDCVVMEKLDHVDSLMTVHPDSAFTLLENLREEAEQVGEAERMRHLLLTADACNKLYRQMPSPDDFQQVVDYYDGNGTSNERMRAMYLMGCIYRDMGESPASIECYEKALQQADTLSDECDYRIMMRICGQMSDVFDAQIIPDRELVASQAYCKYALKCGDTIEYIRGIDLQARPYWDMGDIEGVLNIEKTAADLYRKHGMMSKAASVSTSTIYILILRKQYEEAKRLMDDFENNSGLFDTNGEIVPGRRHYYYSKGLYYTGVEKYDSAEIYFRKVIEAGFLKDGYNGLLNVYRQIHNDDSIYKYLSLYDVQVNAYLDSLKTVSTANVSSLYNYNRNKVLAEKRQEEADAERKRKMYLVWAISSIIILCSLGYVSLNRKRKREELRHREKFLHLKKNLAEVENDLFLAENNFQALISKKEQEIQSYRKQLSETGLPMDGNSCLQHSAIYAYFQNHREMHSHYKCPGANDWRKLTHEFQKCLPEFYHNVCQSNLLSKEEKKVCMLLRIEFSTKEIQLVMNRNSIQSVSNSKLRIMKKLGDNTYGRLEDLLSHWK